MQIKELLIDHRRYTQNYIHIFLCSSNVWYFIYSFTEELFSCCDQNKYNEHALKPEALDLIVNNPSLLTADH